MCGISCVFCADCRDYICQLDILNKCSRLSRRGPDKSCVKCICLQDTTKLILSGHVLHLRGEKVISQPAQHPTGNCLLWNGEIFNKIQALETENDTSFLLQWLNTDSSDQHILNTLSQLQGPWAFIYWQSSTETLWFGRDVFGRRSLLWHLPSTPGDEFVLSSVQINPWSFCEVPAIGLFKLRRVAHGSTASLAMYQLTLFPWQRAVWPGSLHLVVEEKDFCAKLCEGMTVEGVQFQLCPDQSVPSQLPPLNKDLPPPEFVMSSQGPDQNHLAYLKELLQQDSYLTTLSRQLSSVLLESVKTRVFNLPRNKKADRVAVIRNSVSNHSASCQQSFDSPHNGTYCLGPSGSQEGIHSDANVAILFSGGIDSTVIATLADKCVPKDEAIDLLNVAFEQKPKETVKKKKHLSNVEYKSNWDVPDRLTGMTALSELNPDRQWNFISVNVTAQELQEARSDHIRPLLYPLETVLDDSIGCAVWFAARGQGILGAGPQQGTPIHSTARVILCGMGADEQLIGYSRHRVKFKEAGWSGLVEEIELEVTRISARNLGRDDRIITDHGKESRFPFLDEQVVVFLSGLPVHYKANLQLPRGLGEKLLLRLSAVELGLERTATLPKRAIQFGSRIAKMENSKEKGSDKCGRLVQSLD